MFVFVLSKPDVRLTSIYGSFLECKKLRLGRRRTFEPITNGAGCENNDLE